MRVVYKDYKDHEDWIKGREHGIGASEAAVAIGQSNYKTPLELWNEKLGNTQPADLSQNERVVYGTLAEEHLRALYTLKHTDEYEMEYHAFRVYNNTERPYMTCTLDGELTDKATGKRGVWECKTAVITSRADLAKWENGSIPQQYYIQVLHQLYVTQYDFAILNAELRYPNGTAEIREYRIDTTDEGYEKDLATILKGEDKFWEDWKLKRAPGTRLFI